MKIFGKCERFNHLLLVHMHIKIGDLSSKVVFPCSIAADSDVASPEGPPKTSLETPTDLISPPFETEICDDDSRAIDIVVAFRCAIFPVSLVVLAE